MNMVMSLIKWVIVYGGRRVHSHLQTRPNMTEPRKHETWADEWARIKRTKSVANMPPGMFAVVLVKHGTCCFQTSAARDVHWRELRDRLQKSDDRAIMKSDFSALASDGRPMFDTPPGLSKDARADQCVVLATIVQRRSSMGKADWMADHALESAAAFPLCGEIVTPCLETLRLFSEDSGWATAHWPRVAPVVRAAICNRTKRGFDGAFTAACSVLAELAYPGFVDDLVPFLDLLDPSSPTASYECYRYQMGVLRCVADINPRAFWTHASHLLWGIASRKDCGYQALDLLAILCSHDLSQSEARTLVQCGLFNACVHYTGYNVGFAPAWYASRNFFEDEYGAHEESCETLAPIVHLLDAELADVVDPHTVASWVDVVIFMHGMQDLTVTVMEAAIRLVRRLGYFDDCFRHLQRPHMRWMAACRCPDECGVPIPLDVLALDADELVDRVRAGDLEHPDPHVMQLAIEAAFVEQEVAVRVWSPMRRTWCQCVVRSAWRRAAALVSNANPCSL